MHISAGQTWVTDLLASRTLLWSYACLLYTSLALPDQELPLSSLLPNRVLPLQAGVRRRQSKEGAFLLEGKDPLVSMLKRQSNTHPALLGDKA